MSGSRKDALSATPRAYSEVIDSLAALGFSQYEARTYVGLLGQEPMTGYALAKETQVPQPKIYETLGRLVERGFVVQVSGRPAKFISVSAARVLAELETSFRQRLINAELEMSRMQPADAASGDVRIYHEASSWTSIAIAARQIMSQARGRMYISGHSAHLKVLADAITTADARAVRI